MNNIEDMQLQQIAASMLIDCNRQAFCDIQEAFDRIMFRMIGMIGTCGIACDQKELQHTVIDSIALGLKLTLGKRDINE